MTDNAAALAEQVQLLIDRLEKIRLVAIETLESIHQHLITFEFGPGRFRAYFAIASRPARPIILSELVIYTHDFHQWKCNTPATQQISQLLGMQTTNQSLETEES
jgi:hypothetical protein